MRILAAHDSAIVGTHRFDLLGSALSLCEPMRTWMALLGLENKAIYKFK